MLEEETYQKVISRFNFNSQYRIVTFEWNKVHARAEEGQLKKKWQALSLLCIDNVLLGMVLLAYGHSLIFNKVVGRESADATEIVLRVAMIMYSVFLLLGNTFAWLAVLKSNEFIALINIIMEQQCTASLDLNVNILIWNLYLSEDRGAIPGPRDWLYDVLRGIDQNEFIIPPLAGLLFATSPAPLNIYLYFGGTGLIGNVIYSILCAYIMCKSQISVNLICYLYLVYLKNLDAWLNSSNKHSRKRPGVDVLTYRGSQVSHAVFAKSIASECIPLLVAFMDTCAVIGLSFLVKYFGKLPAFLYPLYLLALFWGVVTSTVVLKQCGDIGQKSKVLLRSSFRLGPRRRRRGVNGKNKVVMLSKENQPLIVRLGHFFEITVLATIANIQFVIQTSTTIILA